MDKTMTPSKPITGGQAAKFDELFVARLRKSGMPSEIVQQVLAEQGDAVADEMLAVIRKRVEALTGMICRRVKVNRSRTPQEMLDATGRAQYTDKDVVAAMPKDGKDEEDVYFFKPDKSAYVNGYISDDEAARQLELRNLKPDPYAQGAVNEADPAFADECPNGTQWKNKDGKYCFATFRRWDDGRRSVLVHRFGSDAWDDRWFLSGVRK